LPEATNALRVTTSLRLGERVVTRCGDGLLAAEYALFDATQTVLRATDPVTIREAGYMTTAREALGHLATVGVTPEFAAEAAAAIPAATLTTYARGSAARAVASKLGAHEIFDGAIYSAVSQRYEGAWLDLRSLSSALNVPSAPVILQALHLAAALAEVAATTPIMLSTATATRDKRPGERTHFRVILNGTRGLVRALKQLAPNARPIEIDAASDRRLRDVLLSRVRERMTADCDAKMRAHLTSLEQLLETDRTPIGPLADPELREIERQLANGNVSGVSDRLDALEEQHGPISGIRYLRARAALLQGEEPPRAVAQTMSKLAEEENGFHEAVLVAARAWLAAGEDAHARYFARRVADNAGAPDNERLDALEILDATPGTNQSQIPPPMEAQAHVVAPSAPPSPPRTALARVPRFPSLGDLPPPDAAAMALSVAPPPVPWRQPQLPVEHRGRRAGRRYDPELAESLSLPFGATESILGLNEVPTSPLKARVAMTRLARDLARDYRLWYTKSLRCDVLAVDAMQQHLTRRFAGAPISDPAVAWELRRHGAFLSEILARALGADWVDVGPSEPGYWAMLIPPSSRSWPIGRVYRFVALGHRERDLVSYYLDHESRARGAE
jgi:hypothetical protein